MNIAKRLFNNLFFCIIINLERGDVCMDQNFSLIEPQAQATEGTAKKNNTKLYAIIGGAVLVVLILIGVLAGGGSVDSVVKKYADACVDFDAAKIVSVKMEAMLNLAT